MKATFIQRFLAYVIDMILIILIVNIIGSAFNQKQLKELDKELNDKLNTVESVEQFYDDSSEELLNELADIQYRIDKASAPITAVNIIISIGYFIIFQYMNNGQTLGKKLFKIKVQSEKKEKLSLMQITVRILLINVIAFNFINVLAVVFLSKDLYLAVNSIVTFGQWIIFIASVLLILYNKDKNGVHDMLAKTKVINERG